ncbi:methanogenesis marker protein 11 [Methanocaldococcus villosus KIN24-T80]|uniref:Methanogenesis marker protein 11 n=1 Tax=Methanocaldococcus villosus KIN24-T80 TaxID=1069083 RepID=N6VY15_9EURY|nr:methanogenesis marker protein 11 [Methanocaldococcus villosus KIN24-T80]
MYKRIIALVDEPLKRVELIEEHPCPNGNEWMIYQYKRTSPLIISAWREGNKHHFLVKIGKERLNLIPSLAAAGIEEVYVEGDRVHIIHAGLAGAGVGVELRKGAENVIEAKIIEKGGGSKLGKGEIVTRKMYKVIVGIDDTDTKDEGATWLLAHKIGLEIEKMGLGYYLDHTTVQLYPKNPEKTQNCVSIALSFAVFPEYRYKICKSIKKLLKENTLSDNTAMAIYYGLFPSKSLKLFALKAKKEIVSLEEAKLVALRNNVDVIEITGEKGIIGAVAALGLAEHHNIAPKLPEDL